MQFQRQIRSFDSYIIISMVVLPSLKRPYIGHWLDLCWNTVHVFQSPTTRSKKISLNKFNVELLELSVETLDAKVVSLTRYDT